MLQIEVEEKDSAVVVSIAGELTLKGIEDFERAFEKYLENKPDVIALDLKHLPYLDSFGISRIIKVSRMIIAAGIDFVMINMNENIHNIFRMSTFDRLFNIMTGEEFEREYFPQDTSVILQKTAKADEFSESEESADNHKIRQVELVDNTGTTLIFLDEE